MGSPRRVAGKHRGLKAIRLTVSKRLAAFGLWKKRTHVARIVPEFHYGATLICLVIVIRCRSRPEAGQGAAAGGGGAGLQQDAARMAASCVRSCRLIHVVTRHEAAYRSVFKDIYKLRWMGSVCWFLVVFMCLDESNCKNLFFQDVSCKKTNLCLQSVSRMLCWSA